MAKPVKQKDKKALKKSRFLHLHTEANAGKIRELEALQEVYTSYLKNCTDAMLTARRFTIPLQELQKFFPQCSTLSSQIVKNVRSHAVAIISGWAASKYAVTLKERIKSEFEAGRIDEELRTALYILGKKLVDKPSGKVTQAALDLFWSWMLDESIVGKTPTISNRCGMRMSEMTSTLATSEDTKLTTWWLGFSHLGTGKARIQLPLIPSPYAKSTNDVSKGVLARKTEQGRWRFEVLEKKSWEVPEPTADMPRIGLDVGLNVVAATSDGTLFGTDLKSAFDGAYRKIKKIRANRQRQGLPENSPRLDRLESKLSGRVKTKAGTIANKLVLKYSGYVFVVEDLFLNGCKGSKRFAYTALLHALCVKAPCLVVNPAFTSQLCPSCGYLGKSGRRGTKFQCRGCGRKGHADVIGAINLLGRSEDKQIDCDTRVSAVKVLLRKRYRQRCLESSSSGLQHASVPSDRRLTTWQPEGVRTASNLVGTQSE